MTTQKYGILHIQDAKNLDKFIRYILQGDPVSACENYVFTIQEWTQSTLPSGVTLFIPRSTLRSGIKRIENNTRKYTLCYTNHPSIAHTRTHIIIYKPDVLVPDILAFEEWIFKIIDK